ncbi:cupin domain-containing protein [Propionimicrobium sp. PCR01-08-3]|uniref:cupin domain-containing protein n=1 Tax=Propionimicrobium sp. PCR01-08-3 TaxID=3052086 RepID=UPI00255C67DA|nr:cupin domain-containing protein [Propionimicrobium sp. PCR01-08-3]WIY83244.1 cupin domain-containing protein [Propionimicrobium sp. PCR01-08-3]
MPRFQDVMEHFPFEPEDKAPMLIRKTDYMHHIYPPNNAFTSDNNYLIVSTDTLLLGIYELAPGGSFEPIDIHPGDEMYYILEGPVVQKSNYGQYVEIQTGEGLLIPQETWHQGNNFSDHKVRILFFIAPKAWGEDVPPKVFPTADDTKTFKGRKNGQIPDVSGVQGITRMPTTDDLGRWPIDGRAARQKPSNIWRITDQDKLVTLLGNDSPMLMKFTVSTDYGHMGEMIVPPGGGKGPRCSEPTSHEGDLVLYCMEGPITVNFPERLESFIMEPEESIFVPAGEAYQLVNFDGYPVRAVFAIAPGL